MPARRATARLRLRLLRRARGSRRCQAGLRRPPRRRLLRPRRPPRRGAGDPRPRTDQVADTGTAQPEVKPADETPGRRRAATSTR
jgi:hypothetical protein